ncbi:ubiquitin-like-conjugating enzyme ATG10 isoform X3 [Sapajus apella]|uniref:Ubiquitin-like-conjugating enzyme ATG10 n=1 Tax=Sapajus apella TaxID=9515 RepID=A0A6J3HT16_SAPAP|nr:ubiquitin-like-conjugating enzyme ATG10 isoform X3 [Sapajus apella]XP_032132783.1 ubiquitin-like-conjugating enzyme ATG10 isoform X3 [Sapajus apella]
MCTRSVSAAGGADRNRPRSLLVGLELFNMEEDEFIGEKTFQRCCAEFIKHSQQIGDSWEWKLSKEAFELPSDDCEVIEAPAASQVIKYEYHVLYSCSYQVPVLYFRASFLDGRPLTLKDIWEGVHECYKTRLLQGPWDTITQQEHPILGQPFFVLHPCKTNEFMTPVLKNSRKINKNVNYITSWLSIVGPVVGLNLPLSYAKATSQDERNVD